MGWRGQHNRELDAEAEQQAWWASLAPPERWKIRAERYGSLVVAGAVVCLVWLLTRG